MRTIYFLIKILLSLQLLFLIACQSKEQTTATTDTLSTAPLVENTEITPNQLPINNSTFSEVYQTLSEPITTQFPIQIGEKEFDQIGQNDEFTADTLAETFIVNSYPFLKFLKQQNAVKDAYKDYLIYHHYKRFEVSPDVVAVIFYAIPFMQGTGKMYYFELFTFKISNGEMIDYMTLAEMNENNANNSYTIYTKTAVINKNTEKGLVVQQNIREQEGEITSSENNVKEKNKNSTVPTWYITKEGKIQQ